MNLPLVVWLCVPKRRRKTHIWNATKFNQMSHSDSHIAVLRYIRSCHRRIVIVRLSPMSYRSAEEMLEEQNSSEDDLLTSEPGEMETNIEN